MISDYNLFLNAFADPKQDFIIPKVEQHQAFEYTVLMAVILPNQIPTQFVEFIYDCFKHLDFFVEFYFLTVDGLHRNNLGEMHKVIQNFKFFKNQQEFKNSFANIDEKFSINILVGLENYDIAGVYCCNLTQKDWYNNLQKVVYDKFK